MDEHEHTPENPYAAPQSELHKLPMALPASPNTRKNYLVQGIIVGFQFGGLMALMMLLLYAITWNNRSSVFGLLLIPVITPLACITLGIIIGGYAQLMNFGHGIPYGKSHDIEERQ